MDHRQVPLVAGGMQRGRGLGDAIADDRGITHLAVAQAELVMREADGPRVVGLLGLAHSLCEERDPAGRLTPGRGESAVHAPEVRQVSGVEALPRLRRTSERV